MIVGLIRVIIMLSLAAGGVSIGSVATSFSRRAH